jgi:hypothetical protein
MRLSAVILCVFLANITACKKATDDEVWVETKDIVIMPYKSDPVDGKQYLDVIYENVGKDTYRKIKYQLIRRIGAKIDTTERIILPETVFTPKEKRLIPRHIGQSPAMFDEVKSGKIWAIVDTKK